MRTFAIDPNWRLLYMVGVNRMTMPSFHGTIYQEIVKYMTSYRRDKMRLLGSYIIYEEATTFGTRIGRGLVGISS